MTTQYAPPAPSWWDRNWKWFVPTGCLVILVVMFGFAFAVVTFISKAMKSSGAYAEGVAMARADCELQEALGTPITDGMFSSGTINVSGPVGRADLSVPLAGPKNKGRLYIGADKKADRWTFDYLEASIEGAPGRVSLLAPGRRRCS